jgi:DNA-binding transcriptional LysR family regulator
LTPYSLYEIENVLNKRGSLLNKLKAIEVFLTVIDTKGFAAAARRLNISAPSVSRIIKDLEDELDVLLLKRTTRSFTLTHTGQAFYNDCKVVMDKLKEAEIAAKSQYKTPMGRLKITAPAMFGALFVTPVITELISNYPKIKVSTFFSDNLVNLIEDDIDVAIRIGELENSSLIAKKIGSVKWVVCGTPEYLETNGIPQNLNELQTHNLINVRIRDRQYDWTFKDNKIVEPSDQLVVNSILAAKSAAQSGWGLIQTLSYQIIPEIENGTFIPILSEEQSTGIPIHIVHSEGRQVSAKIDAFSKLISKRFKSIPTLNS